MRTRSNDVSPIAGARVASPTALDAGRSPTAPCGEAPTLMSSQAERNAPIVSNTTRGPQNPLA
jgi:hypothetical protein